MFRRYQKERLQNDPKGHRLGDKDSSKKDMMGSSLQDVDPVVSPSWLKEQIDVGNTRLRILDVTWAPNVNKHQQYLEGHIPGAVYFDVMHKVTNTDHLIRNLPSVDDFDVYQCQFGIHKDTHVVVYDGTGTMCGVYIAGRAWWLFRLMGHTNVSVLNGGFQKWKESGYPVSTDVPQLQEGSFRAQFNSSMITNYEDMVENVKTRKYQVIDCRPPDKYQGTNDEPSSGHIPGAVNIPFGLKIINQSAGCLRNTGELQHAFNEAGIDLNNPIAVSCFCGMSSCGVAISAILLGAKDVAIYLGGATEWLARSGSELCEKS